MAELQRKHNDLEATLKSHINDKALFHDANTNYQRQIDALEGQRQKELSTKRECCHFSSGQILYGLLMKCTNDNFPLALLAPQATFNKR